MGSIINSKTSKDSIVFSVKMALDEALRLEGHVNDIHIFSGGVDGIKTNLSGRGKNESTKYFLVPRELRKDIKFSLTKQVMCQRIDTKDHFMFVYLINKKDISGANEIEEEKKVLAQESALGFE